MTTASADPAAVTDPKPVLWSRQGPVGIATLNRPHALNSLTVELLEQLEEHADEAERDHALRVLVVAGAGEKAFCACHVHLRETEDRREGISAFVEKRTAPLRGALRRRA